MKALLRVLLIFTFAVAQVYAQQGTPADSAEVADNTRTTPEKDSQDTPQPPNTSLENKIDAMESDEPPDRTFKWTNTKGLTSPGGGGRVCSSNTVPTLRTTRVNSSSYCIPRKGCAIFVSFW